MRPTGTTPYGTMLVLFVALGAKSAVVQAQSAIRRPSAVPSVVYSTRCNCTGQLCLPTALRAASVVGQIVEVTGDDANDQTERVIAVTPARAACAEIAGIEDENTLHAVETGKIQLIVSASDNGLARRLRAALGQFATIRGTISEQITAHHHTPLLLTVHEFSTNTTPSVGPGLAAHSGASGTATPSAATQPVDGSDPRARALIGEFRLTAVTSTANAALTPAQAQALVGQRISLVSELRVPWGQCAQPTLTRRSMPTAEFLQDAQLTTLDRAARTRLGLSAGSLTEWITQCGTLALRVVESPRGPLLVAHSGVFFSTTRVPSPTRRRPR